MPKKLKEELKKGYIAIADRHKEEAEFYLPAQTAILVNHGFFDDWDDAEVDAFYAAIELFNVPEFIEALKQRIKE